MNKIEQMVKEMCPGGIPYVRLGDYYQRIKGTPITASKMKEIQKDDGEIAIFAGGKTLVYANESDIPSAKIWRNPAMLVQSRGVVDVQFCDMPFTFKNEMWAYTCDSKESVKYLYYYMKGMVPQLRAKAGAMGSFPQIAISDTEEIAIPLPPLPIQEAIVEILDKFESLQQGLQDELQARKKQYEYYRNKLLTQFPNNVEVKEYTLGEICEFRNGYTPSKSHPEFWDGGDIPWFRMEDIRLNGRILSDSIQHITAKGVKGKGLFKANTFILATTATIGEHAMIIADSLANQRFTNLKIRESLEGEICKKYFYYYMYLVDDFCKKHINVSGFASVDMDALKKMKIQIPTSEYQVKVIDFLDKEEGLLSQLGNEISLRKAQYDYYRNMMLSFK